MSESDFYNRFYSQLGIDLPKDPAQLWANVYAKDQVVHENVRLYLEDLVNRGYQVGALTNTAPPFDRVVIENGVYENIRFSIKSHEVGMRKPEIEMYKLIFDHTDASAGEILMVDDRDSNLTPAKELGMQTILVTSVDGLPSEIDILLAEG